MDIAERILAAGFDRVIALDGGECGIAEPALVLAVMTYAAEETPAAEDAWIHPYYPASQRAYRAAAALAAEIPGLSLRPDIRVKPVFARRPGLRQGLNTLSYLPDCGSRFHVQIFTFDRPLPPGAHLLSDNQPLHCGSCRRCMDACPGGAIRPDGFHRERCLRFWQLNGRPVPPDLRPLMGSRLIGCDDCQRCCPHNPAPGAPAGAPFPLKTLLARPKEAARLLADRIGANLALPNRLLNQACVLAACGRRADLLPELEALEGHPSRTVAESAAEARRVIEGGD